MSNKVFNAIIVLILIAAAAFMLIKVFPKDSDVKSVKTKEASEVLHSVEEVSESLNVAFDSGEDGKIKLNISNEISDDELKKVNMSINSMKGNIISFTTYESNNDDLNNSFRAVEFEYEKADTMYVYESIVKGKAIPADKNDAIKLRDKCQKFLEQYIKNYMTDYDKELVIHDYIINNCVYSYSDDNDNSEYSAYGALVNGKAVCSGYAAAANLLLMCSGVESKIVTGVATHIKNGQSESENHAWNQVKIGGEWYHLDVTWDDPVGDKNTLIHEYFNINDNIIGEDHEWDKGNASKCSSMKNNYYMKNGAYIYDKASLENYIRVNLAAGTDSNIECALKGLSVSDDDLEFVYDYSGVYSVSYSLSGNEDYNILSVYINE